MTESYAHLPKGYRTRFVGRLNAEIEPSEFDATGEIGVVRGIEGSR